MALHMKFREEFAAPPERVFAALTELDHAAAWMPNFVKIEKLTSGSFGVGTTWRETRKMFGREATEQFEVTAFEPNKLLELYIDGTKGASKRGYYRFRYDLEPQGDGTVVNLSGEIGGGGWLMDLIGRLFVGAFKKSIAKDMAAMKTYVERGKPAG